MSDAISVSAVSFEADGEPCAGFLTRPAVDGPAPAVVLLSAIAGINDYIQRVAYALAVNGYVCYAMDYFVREGGPPELGSPKAIADAVAALPDPRVRHDLKATTGYLREQSFVKEDSVGVLGFCIGGTYGLFAAADQPDLGCVIDFYGQLRYRERTDNKPESALDVASKAGCPVLAHYGDRDHIVPPPDVAELRDSLAGKPAEVFRYSGAGHAFHEDFRPAVYRPVAANEAWRRSIAYLDWYLRRDQLQAGWPTPVR